MEWMNTKEMTASLVRDFLESHPPSRLIRWMMVLFLLFNGIPQKTVAAITNYTDRQVRNIRAQYEHSNGDFPWEGKKRGRKKKIKKRIFGRIVNINCCDHLSCGQKRFPLFELVFALEFKPQDLILEPWYFQV